MNYQENIQAYIDGDLHGEDLTSFEAQLKQDEELAAEVDNYRLLAEGVMAVGLREQMKALAKEQSSEKQDSGAKIISFGRYRTLAIAASVALLLGALLFQNLGGNQNGSVDAFASVYYTDPGTPVTMGGSDESTFNEAMIAYKNGSYESASTSFQNLCDLSSDIRSCYYQAQSLLNLEDYAQAEALFAQILDHTEDLTWKEKSEWYLAYALFKQDKTDYKNLIKQIADSPGHRFNVEAKSVLNKK